MYPKPKEDDMRHEIPKKNWHMQLADVIKRAADGDTIVGTSTMIELAQRAQKRMCPAKTLTWEVQ
jgi:hypothetical protein